MSARTAVDRIGCRGFSASPARRGAHSWEWGSIGSLCATAKTCCVVALRSLPDLGEGPAGRGEIYVIMKNVNEIFENSRAPLLIRAICTSCRDFVSSECSCQLTARGVDFEIFSFPLCIEQHSRHCAYSHCAKGFAILSSQHDVNFAEEVGVLPIKLSSDILLNED